MCLQEIFKERRVLQKHRCHVNLARFKDFSGAPLGRLSAQRGNAVPTSDLDSRLLSTDSQGFFSFGVNARVSKLPRFSRKPAPRSSILASSVADTL